MDESETYSKAKEQEEAMLNLLGEEGAFWFSEITRMKNRFAGASYRYVQDYIAGIEANAVAFYIDKRPTRSMRRIP
jgi:flavin reductase (DIM6/NTAB) family NADH-FMN oxidoreductase RutF